MTQQQPNQSEAEPASAESADIVVPYEGPHEGREYICPDCETRISEELQRELARPAEYADALNPVLKCFNCSMIFSPKVEERTIVRLPLQNGAEMDVSEIGHLVEATRITIPYPTKEYICPECKRSIPTRKQIRLAKPAQYAHTLNDVLKCPYCTFLFSPKPTQATVLRG